jgi:RHS repeat-associated protein
VFSAYGELESQTNPTTNTAAAVNCLFAYTGRPLDQATGLQNNDNRWYNAIIGRWLSQDPIGFGGGDANLYRYCGNSSINWIDPSGLRIVIAVTDNTSGNDLWWWCFWYGNPGDPPFSPNSDPATIRVVGSPEELAQLVESMDDGSIDELILSGHGHDAGVSTKSGGSISVDTDPAILARIAKKLSKNAKVEIWGCGAGDAMSLPGLHILADRLHATVIAPSGVCGWKWYGHLWYEGELVTVPPTAPPQAAPTPPTPAATAQPEESTQYGPTASECFGGW